MMPLSTASAAMRIGVEAGLNEGLLTYHDNRGFFALEPDYHPAWSAGVVVEPQLGRRVRIQTGLRYIEYGDVEPFTFIITGPPGSGPPEVFGFRFHDTLRYLDLPVRLSFQAPVSRRITFELGPEVRWLAQALARSESDVFDEEIVTDQTSDFRRWTAAFSGGVGWEIPVAGHTGALRMRYVHGLMNELRTSVERRTRGVELNAGMYW